MVTKLMVTSIACGIHTDSDLLCFNGLSFVSGPVTVPNGIPVFFDSVMGVVVGVVFERDDDNDGSTILVG